MTAVHDNRSTPPPAGKKSTWNAAVPWLVALTAILGRLPALGAYWNQDDWGLLAAASGLSDAASPAVRWLSRTLYWDAMWPLAGLDPVPYAWTRLALHALAAAGVATLARRLRLSTLQSLVAGLVMAASPLAFTPLYWAAGVQDLLAVAAGDLGCGLLVPGRARLAGGGGPGGRGGVQQGNGGGPAPGDGGAGPVRPGARPPAPPTWWGWGLCRRGRRGRRPGQHRFCDRGRPALRPGRCPERPGQPAGVRLVAAATRPRVHPHAHPRHAGGRRHPLAAVGHGRRGAVATRPAGAHDHLDRGAGFHRPPPHAGPAPVARPGLPRGTLRLPGPGLARGRRWPWPPRCAWPCSRCWRWAGVSWACGAASTCARPTVCPPTPWCSAPP